MKGRRWVMERALAQEGLVTRAQLLAMGLSSAAAFRCLRRGELEYVYDGVYRLPGVLRTWRHRAKAVALYAGEDVSAFSHRTAGYLHGLDGFHAPPMELDLTLRKGREATLAGVTVHHARFAPRVSTRQSLPVTQLAWTLIDLAGELDPLALELALDSAHRKVGDLGAWLGRLLPDPAVRSRGGVTTLRELLRARMDTNAESALEVKVWRALRGSSLPAPEKQVELRDGEGFVMRVDFAWRTRRVALHVDGYRWHHQAHRLTRDAEQRRRLTVEGWRQVVVTSHSLKDDRWLADLARLLDPQLGFGTSLRCLEEPVNRGSPPAPRPNVPRDPAPGVSLCTNRRPGAVQLSLLEIPTCCPPSDRTINEPTGPLTPPGGSLPPAIAGPARVEHDADPPPAASPGQAARAPPTGAETSTESTQP